MKTETRRDAERLAQGSAFRISRFFALSMTIVPPTARGNGYCGYCTKIAALFVSSLKPSLASRRIS